MARLIREEELGFVVPNGDLAAGRRALLEAKANPERLRRMGEKASRYLREHFTLAQATAISKSSRNICRNPSAAPQAIRLQSEPRPLNRS